VGLSVPLQSHLSPTRGTDGSLAGIISPTRGTVACYASAYQSHPWDTLYLTIPLKGTGAPTRGTRYEQQRPHPQSARQSQVAAYAVARSWTARFGLPTHIEADILRACNGIGDTTADEWAVIQGYIVPSRPYRAVCRDGLWRTVANDGTEFPFLSSRTARRWRHVDRLRGVANSAPAAAAETPPRLSERCERGTNGRVCAGAENKASPPAARP
jgi:hypothetical protein